MKKITIWLPHGGRVTHIVGEGNVKDILPPQPDEHTSITVIKFEDNSYFQYSGVPYLFETHI